MKQLHVQAPGRINLIGEHLDYNHGIVLPAAIDRYFEFDFQEIQSSFILIEALDLNEKWEFLMDELKDSQTTGWRNYVKGVFLLMGLDSHPPMGINIRSDWRWPVFLCRTLLWFGLWSEFLLRPWQNTSRAGFTCPTNRTSVCRRQVWPHGSSGLFIRKRKPSARF
jgi:hypothetical protein